MLRRILDGLNRGLEFFTAVSMGVLVVDVTWQVITRFILRNPSEWTEELATYLMIWVGLLGSAVAFNRKAHLGIDYFVGKLTLQKRRITECVVYLFTFVFSLLVMFFGGLQLVSKTFAMGQTSPALGLPLGYVYLCIPVAGFFLTIYSLEYLIDTLQTIKNSSSSPLRTDASENVITKDT